MLIADAVERYGPYIYNIRIAAAASRPRPVRRVCHLPKHPKRHIIPKAPVLPDAFSFFAAAQRAALHSLSSLSYIPSNSGVRINFRSSEKTVDKRREICIIVFVRQDTAGLCKGSTADSDSVCEGSNPSPAAKGTRLSRVPFLFLFLQPFSPILRYDR